MTLPFDDLEHVYDALAVSIDEAGPEREALFLAKLTLMLADAVDDVAIVHRCLATSLANLPPLASGEQPSVD